MLHIQVDCAAQWLPRENTSFMFVYIYIYIYIDQDKFLQRPINVSCHLSSHLIVERTNVFLFVFSHLNVHETLEQPKVTIATVCAH